VRLLLEQLDLRCELRGNALAGGDRASPRARGCTDPLRLEARPAARPAAGGSARPAVSLRSSIKATSRSRTSRARRSGLRSNRDACGTSSSAGRPEQPEGLAEPLHCDAQVVDALLRGAAARLGKPSPGDQGGSPAGLSMTCARPECDAAARRSGSAWPYVGGYFMTRGRRANEDRSCVIATVLQALALCNLTFCSDKRKAAVRPPFR